MGKIKKVLAMDEIPFRTITPNMIWTDLCENVHLHYRNLRLDFSHKEWAHFRAAIYMMGLVMEEQIEKTGHREGDPNFLMQIKYNQQLKTDSKYYPNRCTIEVQRDNTVHMHYRDLRVHMTFEECRQIAQMFSDALKQMDEETLDLSHILEATQMRLPIDKIQPYDEGHRPMDIDAEHKRGIEYVKLLIQSGKKIRPILVNTDGQRLDGFKRYMAFKELGYTEIDCIVDPYANMGGQHGQSFVLEENGNGESVLCIPSEEFSVSD